MLVGTLFEGFLDQVYFIITECTTLKGVPVSTLFAERVKAVLILSSRHTISLYEGDMLVHHQCISA